MINHKLSRKLTGVLISMTWCSLILAQGIPDGPYLGQTPPGFEPQLFAPDIVSLANRFEFNGSFTPDGQEFYFTVSNSDWSGNRVMMTHQWGGAWATPEVAPFSGQYIDWGVYLSLDGQQLFFGSSRPDQSWATFNVWMCERQGSMWSDPVKLALNSSGRDYAGTCTWDGIMYFGSERHGLISIFRSVPVAGEYTPAEKLPYPINAGGRDLNPCIAPDESYLIFASDRRASQDLYISYRREDDSWEEPINLGPPVNTPDSEWNPSLSPDGQYLFFSRSTGEPTGNPQNFDLYWVDIGAVILESTDPNAPIQNLRSEQRFNSIQRAIIYAMTGDTLVIEPGVYYESITLNKDITLQSVDPNDPYYIGGTIIQTNMNESVVTLNFNSSSCTLAGLTLRAGSVGVVGTGTCATLYNCRIMDNVSHGVELAEGSSPKLEHCLITANGQNGMTLHATTGRQSKQCEPQIIQCFIINNGGNSIVGGKPVIEDSLIEEQ